MVKVKSPLQIPYGGIYRIQDRLTNETVSGMNLEILLANAKASRRANGAPIGAGFDEEVEKWVCEDYPAECGLPETLTYRPSRNWDMHAVVSGTEVFAKRALTGQSLVDQQEANRRASICAACPKATSFHKPCAGLCAALVKMLSGVGSRSTPYDSDVRACSICGCWCKVSVWYPLGLQQEVLSPEQKEAFKLVPNCWKKEGL